MPFIARYRKEATGTARRRAAAHARGAAALPARAGGAAGGDPGVDPVPGQARRRARGADHRRRLQGPAGGHLPAVQAEAADQGADRPRGRAGAAGRRCCWATRPSTRATAAGGFVDADKGRRRRRRAGRRPGDPGRAVRRGRRPDRRRCASGCGAAAGWSPGCGRGRRRRARSSPTTSTSPSRSPGCPRTGSWRMFRGEKEGVLDRRPRARRSRAAGPTRTRRRIAARFGIADRGRPADRWLLDTVRWAWRTRILVHLGVDLRVRLRQAAEDEAVRVFAANLRDLLLAAPAGTRPTMGLDPGLRTGVKVAVVDAHRQGGRHRHHLPARAAPAVGRVAGHAGPAGPRAHGSSWSRSATAPPPGRPTSSPAT